MERPGALRFPIRFWPERIFLSRFFRGRRRFLSLFLQGFFEVRARRSLGTRCNQNFPEPRVWI